MLLFFAWVWTLKSSFHVELLDGCHGGKIPESPGTFLKWFSSNPSDMLGCPVGSYSSNLAVTSLQMGYIHWGYIYIKPIY